MPDPHLLLAPAPRRRGAERRPDEARGRPRRDHAERGLRWCALQISPGNERAAELLREACARRGAGFGTWAQGLPAAAELAAVRSYGSTFHIANVETAHEDAVPTDAALDELVSLRLPNGLAVIFTEGAWGRDRERSQRWRKRGFAAIPEAIVSENPQATIGAMLELSAALGWPGERTAPCLYLTRGFKAEGYGGQIALTAGRWNLFRYGDVDGADWEAMRGWPRAAPPAPGTLPDADAPAGAAEASEQPAKPAKPAAARALSRCGPRSSRRSSAGTRRRPPPRGARRSGGSRTPTTRHGRSWRHRSWPRSTPRACQEETRPPRLLRPLRASAAPVRRPRGRSRPSGRSSSAAAGPA